MGDQLEPLLRGAVSLVMASSSLVSGCGHEVPPGIEGDPEFVAVPCDEPEGAWLSGVTTEPPLDYLELREATGDLVTVASVGEACATAQDPEACRAQVKSALSSQGFWLGECSDYCTQYYLVATQGDEVSILASKARVAGLFGTIDTPDEATTLVRMQGYTATCGKAGAKPQAGGFSVQVFTHPGCDGDTRHLFDVSSDGVVTQRRSDVLKEPDPNCVVGRRPAGLRPPRHRDTATPAARYLADAARLEAASVDAFRNLTTELVAHRAPRRLVRATRRAADDEVRHARVTAALARRFGALHIEPPRVSHGALRNLEDIALDNAIEGCVRETFGAAVGVWQAQQARDAAVARAMRRIAADELRHAALAWEIAAWSERLLRAGAQQRVHDARRAAVAELGAELRRQPHPSLVGALGVPSAPNALRLHRELERSVWT